MDLRLKKHILGIDVGFAAMGLSLFAVVDYELVPVKFKVITSVKNFKKAKNIRVVDDDMERVKFMVGEFTKFYDKWLFDRNILVAMEMPTGGAQAARPNRCMGMSSALAITFFTMYEEPMELVTPQEVKLAMTGNRNASKVEMMQAAGIKFKLKAGYDDRNKPKFEFNDKRFTLSEFEHIADSIGAVLHVQKTSELYKIFIKE